MSQNHLKLHNYIGQSHTFSKQALNRMSRPCLCKGFHVPRAQAMGAWLMDTLALISNLLFCVNVSFLSLYLSSLSDFFLNIKNNY